MKVRITTPCIRILRSRVFMSCWTVYVLWTIARRICLFIYLRFGHRVLTPLEIFVSLQSKASEFLLRLPCCGLCRPPHLQGKENDN